MIKEEQRYPMKEEGNKEERTSENSQKVRKNIKLSRHITAIEFMSDRSELLRVKEEDSVELSTTKNDGGE